MSSSKLITFTKSWQTTSIYSQKGGENKCVLSMGGAYSLSPVSQTSTLSALGFTSALLFSKGVSVSVQRHEMSFKSFSGTTEEHLKYRNQKFAQTVLQNWTVKCFNNRWMTDEAMFTSCPQTTHKSVMSEVLQALTGWRVTARRWNAKRFISAKLFTQKWFLYAHHTAQTNLRC